MKRQQVDLLEVYGYEPALLDAARERSWFVQNSEPVPSLTCDVNWVTEASMTKMMEERTTSSFGIQRKLEANLRSL